MFALGRFVSQTVATNTRNLSIINVSRNRIFRWLDIYEEFIGLKEVKQAQNFVNDVT